MGYVTKVQLIKRLKSEQYYINFPAAVAQVSVARSYRLGCR